MIPGILFFAAAAMTVKTDQPLRAGCAASDPIVATVRAGDRVQVKFGLAGDAQACFLVAAMVDGKEVEGNLPASALTGLDQFERERRDARSVGAPQGSAPAPSPAPAPVPEFKIVSPELARVSELMRANQPAEALEILQRVLKVNPRNPDLLSAAATAAYRSDNLRLALEYWRASLELRADPAVQSLYDRARRETSNDKSGEKKYGSRFMLRYDGAAASEDQARAMLAILDAEFARVSFELGCRAEERIVTIVQTRDAYLRTTGAPEWSGGGYDGKIHIPLLERGQADAEMRKRLAHEIVHACLANIGQWPLWLHEGLAQKLTGATVPPAAAQSLRALAKSGKLPKLGQLGASWSGMSAVGATGAYALALTAVEAFYKHHAGFGIRNLLNNPSALPGIVADLDARLAAGDW
jgi:hypothetical protein